MLALLLMSMVRFLEQHKALEVVLAWIFLQYLNSAFLLPTEWFIFAYYSLASFAQAAEVGLGVFILYSLSIFSVDYLVFYYLPGDLIPLVATCLAHTFLVSGLHGLNLRGVLLILVSTTFVVAYRDGVIPSSVTKPVAAHCAGFGLCWFSWGTAQLLYKYFDNFCLYVGLVAPDPPAVFVKNVTPRSCQIYWFSPHATLGPVTGVQVVREHQIEVNGVIVGKTQPHETKLAVQGLDPEETYLVRVVVITKRAKAISRPVVIRTPPETAAAPTTSKGILALTGNGDGHPELLRGGLVEEMLMSNSGGGHRSAARPRVTIEGEERGEITGEQGGADKQAVMTTSSVMGGEDQQEAVTQEMMDDVREEIETVRAQRLEVERSTEEVSEAAARQEDQVRSEIQLLKEGKKGDEKAKLKFRQTVTGLEAAKARVDLQKSKLEKEARAEATSKSSLTEGLAHCAHQVSVVSEGTVSLERQLHECEGSFATQKRDVERALISQKAEALLFNSSLQEKRGRRDEAGRQMEKVEEERQRLEFEVKRLGQGPNSFDRQRKLEQEWRALQAKYRDMALENKRLQETLREETQQKMRLFQELARARNEREQGSAPASASPSPSSTPSPGAMTATSTMATTSTTTSSSPTASPGQSPSPTSSPTPAPLSLGGSSTWSPFAMGGFSSHPFFRPSAAPPVSGTPQYSWAPPKGPGPSRSPPLPLKLENDDDDDEDPLPYGWTTSEASAYSRVDSPPQRKERAFSLSQKDKSQ